MFRKFVLPALLGVAVLGIAAESAQAQLRARLSQMRERRMERRDTMMRRTIIRPMRTTGMTTYTYQGPGYTTQSISYYYAPTQAVPAVAATASFRVILPDANAKVYVDGVATQQTGMDRMFVTPMLQPGAYNYTIRAVYQVNGREMTHERTIRVTPGRTTVLDLTRR